MFGFTAESSMTVNVVNDYNFIVKLVICLYRWILLHQNSKTFGIQFKCKLAVMAVLKKLIRITIN